MKIKLLEVNQPRRFTMLMWYGCVRRWGQRDRCDFITEVNNP